MQGESDLKEFAKKAQNEERYRGINFMNIGNSKNTIEFRLANGTIDENTWIENINLFGGIIKTAENLAIIQSKPEEERTEEENKSLQLFEELNNTKLTDSERLDKLLRITIDEKERDIYRRRFKTNSLLIGFNPIIKQGITKKTAKKTIDIKMVGKKVFTGEDRVTGEDYRNIDMDIQRRYMQQEKQEMIE